MDRGENVIDFGGLVGGYVGKDEVDVGMLVADTGCQGGFAEVLG